MTLMRMIAFKPSALSCLVIFILSLCLSNTATSQPLGGSLYLKVQLNGETVSFQPTLLLRKQTTVGTHRLILQDNSIPIQGLRILTGDTIVQKSMFWINEYQLLLIHKRDSMQIDITQILEGDYYLSIPFQSGHFKLSYSTNPFNPSKSLIQDTTPIQRVQGPQFYGYDLTPYNWETCRVSDTDVSNNSLITVNQSYINGSYILQNTSDKCYQSTLNINNRNCTIIERPGKSCPMQRTIQRKTGINQLTTHNRDSLVWKELTTFRSYMDLHLIEGHEPDTELGAFSGTLKFNMVDSALIQAFTLVELDSQNFKIIEWTCVSDKQFHAWTPTRVSPKLHLLIHEDGLGWNTGVTDTLQWNPMLTYTFTISHFRHPESILIHSKGLRLLGRDWVRTKPDGY